MYFGFFVPLQDLIFKERF